jgi:hypothetical protein
MQPGRRTSPPGRRHLGLVTSNDLLPNDANRLALETVIYYATALSFVLDSNGYIDFN